MIPRGVRYDSTRRFRLAKRKNSVGRAADFERTGQLKIFAFEKEQRARQLIKRVGNHHLRLFDVGRNTALRLTNGFEVRARR